MTAPPWLTVTRGAAPLIVSLPHAGTDIPVQYESRMMSGWRARKDTDWWIDRLYDFAPGLGATLVRTAISRSVIDVNRDPSGVSLYPGHATTGLCPTTTFDGEALYHDGGTPRAEDIASRRAAFFDPYHAALVAEIARLRATHKHIVVYDCHSIRSAVPRLFEGELPHFNLGTNDGASCAQELAHRLMTLCTATGRQAVLNGRFKGGYITRSRGAPAQGVHAVQMELACRAYLREPPGLLGEANWPPSWDAAYAAPLAATLKQSLEACLAFALEA